MKNPKEICLMFALLLCSGITMAQNKLEILIVASSHNNANSTEDFQRVINKLKSFKPDMVFGEFLSGADLGQLEASNFGKQVFRSMSAFIKRHQPDEVKDLDARIGKAQRLLAKSANLHKERMDLAVNYIKNGDRGNGEYQVYVLENYMKQAFDKDEQDHYQKLFGNIDSLKKVRLLRPASEYHKIYYPLIFELGQNYIYPMDCQKYDGPWSKAWAKADTLIKVMSARAKADSLSPEGLTVKAIQKYSYYSPEEMKALNASPYAVMNTARYGELDAADNFYGGEHFYGYAGFPTAAIKDMIAQWMLRNEGMCENIIRQAKQKNAKRVIVGVGASHRKWMEQILAKRDDVKIVNYNDLP